MSLSGVWKMKEKHSKSRAYGAGHHLFLHLFFLSNIEKFGLKTEFFSSLLGSWNSSDGI